MATQGRRTDSDDWRPRLFNVAAPRLAGTSAIT